MDFCFFSIIILSCIIGYCAFLFQKAAINNTNI